MPPEKGVFPLDHMHLCDLVTFSNIVVTRIYDFWDIFSRYLSVQVHCLFYDA